MKRLSILVPITAALMALPQPAQAHRETYWRCTENGTHSRGTTKVHIHHKKPNPQHMRRHHCVKRHRGQDKVIVKTVTVQVPGPTQVVYVTLPCGTCPSPPSSCQDPCVDGSKDDHGQRNHHGHEPKGGNKGSCD